MFPSPPRTLWIPLLLVACLILAGQAGASAEDREVPLASNVTLQAGLDFRHSSYHGSRVAFYETVAGGACWADYDGDGWQDLYLVNGLGPRENTPSRLYHNEGPRPDGTVTFRDVSRTQGVQVLGVGQGCSWADYDNDGWPDLYVTFAVTDFSHQRNVLFHNRGQGQGFEDVTDETGVDGSAADPRGEQRCQATTEGANGSTLNRCWSVSSAWLDYDLDGDLDLYVGNYAEFPFGSCVEPHDSNPKFCVGQLNRLYRNDGGGEFTEVAAEANVAANSQQSKGRTIGAIAGDVDRDGWPDLYTTNDQDANALYVNQQDGTFHDAAPGTPATGEVESISGQLAEGSGMGVDMDDVDGDGRADLLSTHLDGEWDSVLLQTDDGWRQVAPEWGYNASIVKISRWGGGFVDVDVDGDKDLIVAGSGVVSPVSGPIHLFLNEHSTFDYATPPAWPYSTPPGAAHRSTAFADYDNDGDTDVLVSTILSVSDATNKPRLLRNNAFSHAEDAPGIWDEDRHWLRVELRGTDSARQPVGARVEVTTPDGQAQTQYVTSGGYAASSDPRLLFGLGNQTRAEVEVTWPGGDETTTREVDLGDEAGRALLLTEPNTEPPQPVRWQEVPPVEDNRTRIRWTESFAADFQAYEVLVGSGPDLDRGEASVHRIEERNRTALELTDVDTTQDPHVALAVLDTEDHRSESTPPRALTDRPDATPGLAPTAVLLLATLAAGVRSMKKP